MLSTKSIPRVFTRVTQTPQTFTQLRFKTAKATKSNWYYFVDLICFSPKGLK